MKNQESKATTYIWIVAFLGTMWFALIVASYWQDGYSILDLVNALSLINNPFDITFNEYSIKTILIFSIIYGLLVSAYYASIQNRRQGEEHGSASWGSAKQVKALFSQNKKTDILLTQNVSIGLDTHKHRRNLNVLVVGGSGSGKSRFYVRPNIMQMNTSFVVVDPKQELLNSTGEMLKKNGYDIKVLNLIDFSKSDSYNPFRYIRKDSDVIKLINNLVNNTTPKSAKQGDPFWERAETALLQALMFYLVYEAPSYEQNFSMIMTMLEYGGSEYDEVTALDAIFYELETVNPEHIAVKQYKVFKQAAGKTASSILISAAVRLAAFNISEIKDITAQDDLDIPSLAKRKTALFAVIPDADTSFNFLVGLMYSQVFQEMYYQADHVYSGELPIKLHVIFDEFANISIPDDFEKLLATMRSRGISASVIIQNLSQLKGIFKQSNDAWQNITGNTDTFIYLGGNEKATHDFVSKMLGKATIHLKTHNRTKGRNGSFTTNNQITGRELLTPDEVRLLDNDYAILFIRGAKPVMDKKYDLMKHPKIKQTTDGNGMTYAHKQKVKTLPIFEGINFNKLDKYEVIEEGDKNYEE